MRWLSLVLLVGCGQNLVEDEIEGMRWLSGAVKTGSSGKVTLEFETTPVDTSFLLNTQASGTRTHVVRVHDPLGNRVFDAIEEANGDYSTTNAGYISPVATLNWPRIPDDVLSVGTWRVELGHVSDRDSYVRGDLAVDVLFAEDPIPSSGVVPIALVWAGGTDDDPDLVEAVQEALFQWEILYAAAGLELDLTEFSMPDVALAAPALGTDPTWRDIAESVGPLKIPVVIAPDILDVEDVLGIAGDIPGPLNPSVRSGVLVNALLSAGPDGEFDTEDIRILGETLAHETGHFLGLYHPVELTWDSWDALADTVECKNESKCTDTMADHLMFPFPVCTFSGCTDQDVITADQASVMNHYTGIR